MSHKLSKPMQYALDGLGMLLIVALVYAVGCCTGNFHRAQAQDVVAMQEAPPDDEPGMSGSMQEDAEDADANDAAWTELEVALGQLAIHEGSGRDTDTIGVVSARRGWSLARLREEHPRALSRTPRGTRPWISGLNAELTRPAQWNEGRMAWEGGGQRIWLRTLRLVRRTLNGGARCAGGTPQIWGGRTVDSELLNVRLSQGYRLVDCGSTANYFMRRDRTASR